ncbi:uncharacterized protein RCC_07062 [Ramularia collo-cygni]|uniref:Thioesterase domain-containing protein n=1 Tax=Ramularia collo-cygni TaxID=112498 RepID=A0A2D3V6Y2_9PEZI|nr:uncharacterized protein RCC_07062 [Ramularia collo-cygni]CZT21200.1 uncharacterized protein RCC_07062 [Ramularia collo-cygni]
MSSTNSQQTLFARLTNDPKFINGSPEDKINALLGMSSPDDVRLLSQFLTEDVKLVSYKQLSPTTSSAVFAFRVERFYCNFSGNLHGGAAATFYDVLTSILLQAIDAPGSWGNAGVSRSLSVTYLRPAPEGIMVECDVEVVHSGKSLAFLRGSMKRQDDGKLISTCEHDKAAVKIKAGFEVPSPKPAKM